MTETTTATKPVETPKPGVFKRFGAKLKTAASKTAGAVANVALAGRFGQ